MPDGVVWLRLDCVEQITRIAELLRARNSIDAEIAVIAGRPMTSVHLGEWIASRILDIELEPWAAATAIDGRFRSGPLAGQTVNVTWYLKSEGLLDMSSSPVLDYYLVLTGPASAAASSRGSIRPWSVDAVYLFDSHQLSSDQKARGVKKGVAASVLRSQWDTAEIYPRDTFRLPLTAAQAKMLALLRA
jgi:hypothetical protein